VRRVSVVGNSGSGKSTLSRALAARLGVPYLVASGADAQRLLDSAPPLK
jgi:adenylate kinase family enzyme